MFWFVGNEIGLLWNLDHKKQRFSNLKHVALSLIARKTFYGLFAVKLCCFQRYYTGERFSSSLQRNTLRFTWFYSKQRFYLILAKLRCLRIFFLRTTFSSSFVSKLHFWRSILPKKCLSLWVTKLGCFEPLSTKNMFWLVWCQIGLPAALLHW